MKKTNLKRYSNYHLDIIESAFLEVLNDKKLPKTLHGSNSNGVFVCSANYPATLASSIYTDRSGDWKHSGKVANEK